MREVNLKKLLSASPDHQAVDKNFTFWAAVPEKVPTRVRRAADVYRDIATRTASAREPRAAEWEKVALIMERAASEMEAVFATA